MALPCGEPSEYQSLNDISEKHIQGSNCYSYAFNHIALNGQRPHKAVPGFLTKYLTGKKYPETDWQVCEKHVKQRVLDDGKTVSMFYNIGVPTVKEVRGGSVRSKLAKKPEKEYRRVVMVLAPGERRGVSTDFHFYAQRVIPVQELYNIKLKKYTSGNGAKVVNPYHESNVHPTSSNLQIQRSYNMGNTNCKAIMNTPETPNNRAICNVVLHESIMPKHAMMYIPDPFWMLDIQRHEKLKRDLSEIIHRKMNSLLRELPKKEHRRIVIRAAKLALKNRTTKKDKYVGIWMHKLGWGTGPLNTDGDGKLILNPMKAKKYHGGHDYKITCGVFDVLIGYGLTSPWHDVKMMKKKHKNNFM